MKQLKLYTHTHTGCLNEESKNLQVINKKRYVSIEYLRVICVIFVFLIHFILNLGLVKNYNTLLEIGNTIFSKFLIFVVYAIAKTAVPVFVIISGFCNYKEKEEIAVKIYIKKILKAYIPYLIACVFYLISYICIKEITNLHSFLSFIKSIINFSLPYMWFMGSYFILLLLMPFINKLLKSLTNREQLYLIAVLIIAVCVPTTVNIYISGMLYSSLVKGLEFILFYVVGAYFKINVKNIDRNLCIKFLKISCLAIITAFVLLPISDLSILNEDSLLILVIGITIFICSIGLENKLKSSKIISELSNASIFMYMLGWNYERLIYYALGGTRILRENIMYSIIFFIGEIIVIGIAAITLKWIFDKAWNKVCNKIIKI